MTKQAPARLIARTEISQYAWTCPHCSTRNRSNVPASYSWPSKAVRCGSCRRGVQLIGLSSEVDYPSADAAHELAAPTRRESRAQRLARRGISVSTVLGLSSEGNYPSALPEFNVPPDKARSAGRGKKAS